MIRISSKFPFLTEDDLKSLDEISYTQSYGKREIIIEAYKYSSDFIFTLNGIIRGYYIEESGEEKNVFLVNDDMFFGGPECILHEQPSNYIFETVTDTSLIVFDFKKLEKLAGENENIFRFYSEAFKSIMHFFILRLDNLTSSSPEERFIKLQKTRPLLLQNAKSKLIANFLGISPNSLSRIKSRIRKKY